MKFTQFVKSFRDDNPDLNMSFKDCMQSDVIRDAYKEIVGGNLAPKPAQWAQSKPVQQTQPVQHEHLTRGEWKAPIQRNSTNPKKKQPSSRCPPCSSTKDKKEGVQIIINNNGGGGGGSEQISVGRNGVRGPGPGGPRGPPRGRNDGTSRMEGVEKFDIFGNIIDEDQQNQEAEDRARDPGNQMQTDELEAAENKARADAQAKLDKDAADQKELLMKNDPLYALRNKDLAEPMQEVGQTGSQPVQSSTPQQEQQLVVKPEGQITTQQPATANDERETFFKAFEAFKTLSESPYANFLGLHGNMFSPGFYPNMRPPNDDSNKINELEKTVSDLKNELQLTKETQLQLTKETQQQQAKVDDERKQQRRNRQLKEKIPPTTKVGGSPTKVRKGNVVDIAEGIDVDGRAANDAVDSNKLVVYQQKVGDTREQQIQTLETEIADLLDSYQLTKDPDEFMLKFLPEYQQWFNEIQINRQVPEYDYLKTLQNSKKKIEESLKDLKDR